MTLRLTDHGEDRSMTIDQLISVVGTARPPARTTMTVTYTTATAAPTVYYTALETDGTTVITSRRTAGVSQVGSLPLWKFDQTLGGRSDMIVLWDEGDVNDYRLEWVTVDT